jgi:hypothetical protein
METSSIQPQIWLYSILAKDLPTCHYGLRMECNRRLIDLPDEIPSIITVLEMFANSFKNLPSLMRNGNMVW